EVGGRGIPTHVQNGHSANGRESRASLHKTEHAHNTAPSVFSLNTGHSQRLKTLIHYSKNFCNHFHFDKPQPNRSPFQTDTWLIARSSIFERRTHLCADDSLGSGDIFNTSLHRH